MNALLNKVLNTPVEAYDPKDVMVAVNTLLPLGKAKVLEEITAALSPAKPSTPGAFWILRVLFDLPPEEFFPLVKIGQPDIPPPEVSDLIPRFPIAIIRDIPFLVIKRYDLSGMPEPVDGHMTYFREYGILKHRELFPPKQPDGIEDEFLELWHAAYGDKYIRDATATFKEQLYKVF